MAHFCRRLSAVHLQNSSQGALWIAGALDQLLQIEVHRNAESHRHLFALRA